MATQGEAYLATPEADMTFVERHNVDVIATIMFCGGAIVYVAIAAMQTCFMRLSSTGVLNVKVKAV